MTLTQYVAFCLLCVLAVIGIVWVIESAEEES